jgi:hypothetical protein
VESFQSTLGVDARLLAMSAGAIMQTARREVRAELKAAGGDRDLAIRAGFERLESEGLISARDRERLQFLAGAAVASGPASETRDRVSDAHHAILMDRQSSGAAVAIASCMNGLVTSADGDLPDAVAKEKPHPVLGGAVTGAFFGAFAGPEGVLVGILVGGAVGAVAAACE